MSNLQIAEEIRNQLGNQALIMLGAYDFCGSKNSLMFKIKGSKAFKHIEIIHTGQDLYDIIFIKMRKLEITKREIVSGVYVDMLHKTIEKKTGLYTKL